MLYRNIDDWLYLAEAFLKTILCAPNKKPVGPYLVASLFRQH